MESELCGNLCDFLFWFECYHKSWEHLIHSCPPSLQNLNKNWTKEVSGLGNKET